MTNKLQHTTSFEKMGPNDEHYLGYRYDFIFRFYLIWPGVRVVNVKQTV
jgi:hypothetical protein